MKNIHYDTKKKLEIGKELLNTKLEYRQELDLKNNTFGLELEFCDGKLRTVRDELLENDLKNWKCITDSTVCVPKKGYEHITLGGEVISPIFYGSKEDWQELKKACEIIKFCQGDINEKTAGHIHVGTQLFDKEVELDNFIFLWAAFENVIKKFFYGEFIEGNFFTKLALDCSDEFYFANFNYENLNNLREVRKRHDKSYAVSFHKTTSFEFHINNTIEFRAICGTLEEEVWQNNINFLLHFMTWAKRLTKEEKKLIKENYIDTFEFQKTELNFDKAIFLSNCIFNKEIDKLYFLKQYFKDFYLKDETISKFDLVKTKTI